MKWQAYVCVCVSVWVLNCCVVCNQHFVWKSFHPFIVLSLYIKHFDYLIRYLNDNSSNPSSHRTGMSSYLSSPSYNHRCHRYRFVLNFSAQIEWTGAWGGQTLKTIFHHLIYFEINWAQCSTSQISIQHTSSNKYRLQSFCWIFINSYTTDLTMWLVNGAHVHMQPCRRVWIQCVKEMREREG